MSTEFINDQWRLPNAWNGSESNVNKQSNYSMDFDGSSQYVDLGDDDIFSFGNSTNDSPFSISAWIYMDSTTNFRILAKYDAPNYEYQFDVGGSSNLRFFIFDGTSYRARIGSTLSINQWYHVVATYNGVGGTNAENGIKIYVDGVEITGTTSSNGSYTAMHNTTAPVYIGRIASSYANGKIDGVSIFNYELSSSQITTLYGSSSTGIGNPMSLSPKPVATYNLGDKSAFNGSSYLTPNASLKDFVFDFVPSDNINTSHIGFFDGSTTLSISGWFNFDDISVNRDLMSQWVYNTTNGSFSLRRSSGNLLALFVKTGSSSIGSDYYYANLATSSTGHSAGVWYHLAVTVDNGTCLIYLNGQALTTSTGGSPQTTLQTSTADFKLGYWQTSTTTFNGKMSNIKLWSSKLEATEIETLYNNGSPIETLANIPQNSNLQGWWKLDASATYDSSTTTWNIPDDSTNSNDGTSSGMTQANLVASDLSFKTSISPFALSFDSASSDYIDCGDSDNFSFGNGTTDSPFRFQLG